MKFDTFVEAVQERTCFDLNTLKTYFPKDAARISLMLYRWKRAGRVVELRRGLYSLAQPYRRAPLHGPAVAEAMYHPSYLSLQWALSWYGVVPEKAGIYTSVTTRERRTFSNDLGTFRYRTVKPPLFFGYRIQRILDADVRIAEPEKALVDLWYLSRGEWDAERMASMRFDPSMLVSHERLQEIVDLTESPRLQRAYRAWQKYAEDQSEGEEISG